MTNTPYNVKFHTVDELLKIPEPRWLIQDFLHQQETACLWGPPNCGKSFIAIDWALSIAAGIPWLGRYRTLQSPVIYMAGEGSASLQKRVYAWMEGNEVTDLGGAYFQVRPLPLREEEVIDAILEQLATFSAPEDPNSGLNPGLIIVDTLSQFFGSGDENTSDMALFVSNLRRLSHEQDVSILIVHHSNAQGGSAKGGRERSHSALRGNIDAMYEMEPRSNNILDGATLITDKQRDAAKGEGLAIAFNLVEDSVVPCYDEERNADEEPPPMLSGKLWKMLRAFETLESAKTESCSHDDMMEALELPKRSFHRHLNVLKAVGLVSGAGRGKSAITYAGREAVRRKDAE